MAVMVVWLGDWCDWLVWFVCVEKAGVGMMVVVFVLFLVLPFWCSLFAVRRKSVRLRCGRCRAPQGRAGCGFAWRYRRRFHWMRYMGWCALGPDAGAVVCDA